MNRIFGFFTSILVMFLSEQVLIFSVPLIVFAENKSLADSGLSFFIEWIPALIALPIAGTISDRLGARRHFFASNFIRIGACLLAFAIVTAFPHTILPVVMGLSATMTFFLGQTRVSIDAMTYKLADKSQLVKVQSWYQIISLSTMLVAPALAGVFIKYFPLVYMLGVSAALFTASTVIAYFGIKVKSEPNPSIKKGFKSFFRDFNQAIREISSEPYIILFILTNALLNYGMGMAVVTAPALITETFGKDMSFYGFLGVISGLAGLSSMFLLPQLLKKVSILAVGNIGLAIACTAILGLGMASNFWIYLVAYSGLIVGISLYNIYTRSERVKYIRKESMGRVFSVFYTTSLATLPLAGMTAGIMGPKVDAQNFLIILGVIVTALIVLLTKTLMSSSTSLRANMESQGE